MQAPSYAFPFKSVMSGGSYVCKTYLQTALHIKLFIFQKARLSYQYLRSSELRTLYVYASLISNKYFYRIAENFQEAKVLQILSTKIASWNYTHECGFTLWTLYRLCSRWLLVA